ncbi:hypothetical protein [Halobellus rufus]|uniref:hypothetical protein n=1 Tax=Halobellus rufus TaxID=1448860 RepID=UPI0006789758|nr:hypothetical protein [Halobellus rufus]
MCLKDRISTEPLDQFERTIGVELWNLQPEVRYDSEYGGYRADIIARGYDGDQFVDVIAEVQFDRNKESALSHQRKLFLYGNLADADVLVWLTDAELDPSVLSEYLPALLKSYPSDLLWAETSVR